MRRSVRHSTKDRLTPLRMILKKKVKKKRTHFGTEFGTKRKSHYRVKMKMIFFAKHFGLGVQQSA